MGSGKIPVYRMRWHNGGLPPVENIVETVDFSVQKIGTAQSTLCQE